MTTWLDKLCEPLEHPKYPQIKGKLVQYDKGEREIIGKCAEGEILCQNNIQSINSDYMETVDFISLGVPYDLIREICEANNEEHIWSGLRYGIASLNDMGFTYPEIVEFLRTTFEDAV